MIISESDEVNNLAECAKAYESSNDFDHAAEIYFVALKIEPFNRSLQRSLLASASRNVENFPDDEEAHLALGNAYACSGAFEEAEREFATVLHLSNLQENGAAQSALTFLRKSKAYLGASERASLWFREMVPKLLACAYCNRTTNLIPVLSKQPTPEQTAASDEGLIYLAPVNNDLDRLLNWRCLNCNKTFNSSTRVEFDLNDDRLFPWLMDSQRRIIRAWSPVKGTDRISAVVIFNCHESGKLNDLRLFSSSGLQTVDESALQAVEYGAPLRQLPSHITTGINLQIAMDRRLFHNERADALRRI